MPAKSKTNGSPHYQVMFYDSFDHDWIEVSDESRVKFAYLKSAISKRNKLNKKVAPGNFDHYGVIDLITNMEVDCPINHVAT
jgi:hypothetical protein